MFNKHLTQIPPSIAYYFQVATIKTPGQESLLAGEVLLVIMRNCWKIGKIYWQVLHTGQVDFHFVQMKEGHFIFTGCLEEIVRIVLVQHCQHFCHKTETLQVTKYNIIWEVLGWSVITSKFILVILKPGKLTCYFSQLPHWQQLAIVWMFFYIQITFLVLS